MEKFEWFSFKEKLPPIGTQILCKTEKNDIIIGRFLYHFQYDNDRTKDIMMNIGMTEEMMKKSIGYWALIPEVEKESE